MKKQYSTTSTSSRKVLIVDDEAEIGLLLKRILKQRFAVIEHALTLEEGLAFARQLQPNIILLDNNLPDGSGIEYLDNFKAVYPDAIIIIVSAMTHLRGQAFENGAYAFIEKPLSFQNIMDTLDSITLPQV